MGTSGNHTIINMVYKRFVEAGRVALVTSGKNNGKLAVIVDVIDTRRVLIDNPVNGLPRQMERLQNLNLTDIKINIPHGARGGAVKKAYAEADVNGTWEKSAWAKKLKQKETRKGLSDFDRFKVKVHKQRKVRILKAAKKASK